MVVVRRRKRRRRRAVESCGLVLAID